MLLIQWLLVHVPNEYLTVILLVRVTDWGSHSSKSPSPARWSSCSVPPCHCASLSPTFCRNQTEGRIWGILGSLMTFCTVLQIAWLSTFSALVLSLFVETQFSHFPLKVMDLFHFVPNMSNNHGISSCF